MNDIIELNTMWFGARILSEDFISAYCTWADDCTGLADTLGGFTDEFAMYCMAAV